MTSPTLPAETSPQPQALEADHRSRVLTWWSLAMIPATLISTVAAFVVGLALMAATGTLEGELLISAGIGGWLSWILVVVIMLSAPLAGVVLAVLARRSGADRSATLALVINGLIAAYFAATAIGNVILSG